MKRESIDYRNGMSAGVQQVAMLPDEAARAREGMHAQRAPLTRISCPGRAEPGRAAANSGPVRQQCSGSAAANSPGGEFRPRDLILAGTGACDSRILTAMFATAVADHRHAGKSRLPRQADGPRAGRGGGGRQS